MLIFATFMRFLFSFIYSFIYFFPYIEIAFYLTGPRFWSWLLYALFSGVGFQRLVTYIFIYRYLKGFTYVSTFVLRGLFKAFDIKDNLLTYHKMKYAIRVQVQSVSIDTTMLKDVLTLIGNVQEEKCRKESLIIFIKIFMKKKYNWVKKLHLFPFNGNRAQINLSIYRNNLTMILPGRSFPLIF